MECLFCEVLKAILGIHCMSCENNALVGPSHHITPTILGLRVGDFLFRGIPNKVDLLESIGQVCLLLMLNTAISFMAENKK